MTSTLHSTEDLFANTTQSKVGYYPDRRDVALGACDFSGKELVRLVHKISSDR